MRELLSVLTELAENKLFVAIFQVVLGAGVLAWWLKIRDRRLAVADASLKFVNETGDLLSQALSRLFGVIRRKDQAALITVETAIGELFEHRLSVRANSEALLKTPEFWKEYDRLVWRIRELTDHQRSALQQAQALKQPPGEMEQQIENIWTTAWSHNTETWDCARV